MSKQKVKVLSVDRNIDLQRRSDGGIYKATKLVYQDSAGKVQEKPFANVFLGKNGTLDQQLASLSATPMPVDVVLEMTTSQGKDGKTYNQISALLPGNTVIQPGDEVVVSTYTGPRNGGGGGGHYTSNKGNGDFRSSKVITRTEALKAAVELGVKGSTVESVLETARRFEAFIHEADGVVNTSTGTQSAPVNAINAVEPAVAPSANPFKF